MDELDESTRRLLELATKSIENRERIAPEPVLELKFNAPSSLAIEMINHYRKLYETWHAESLGKSEK